MNRGRSAHGSLVSRADALDIGESRSPQGQQSRIAMRLPGFRMVGGLSAEPWQGQAPSRIDLPMTTFHPRRFRRTRHLHSDKSCRGSAAPFVAATTGMPTNSLAVGIHGLSSVSVPLPSLLPGATGNMGDTFVRAHG